MFHCFYITKAEKAYQWTPVSVEISNSNLRNKLGGSHHKEIQIQEKLELFI